MSRTDAVGAFIAFALALGCDVPGPPSDDRGDMQPLRILCVGDSITMGSPEFIGGYRLRLGELLDLHGIPYEFLGRNTDAGGDHEGYSGYTIAEIRSVALEAVPLFEPDVVLIIAGTNNYPKEDFVEDYPEACVDIADAGVAHVLAGTIPPSGDGPNIIPTQEYNDALPALFDGLDPRVSLHDVCAELTYPEDMGDVTHPNDQGYTEIAQAWFEALLEFSTVLFSDSFVDDVTATSRSRRVERGLYRISSTVDLWFKRQRAGSSAIVAAANGTHFLKAGGEVALRVTTADQSLFYIRHGGSDGKVSISEVEPR
jgi:lysophospholipase L1-like esterase